MFPKFIFVLILKFVLIFKTSRAGGRGPAALRRDSRRGVKLAPT